VTVAPSGNVNFVLIAGLPCESEESRDGDKEPNLVWNDKRSTVLIACGMALSEASRQSPALEAELTMWSRISPRISPL
jgi:hypothetical protein